MYFRDDANAAQCRPHQKLGQRVLSARMQVDFRLLDVNELSGQSRSQSHDNR